MSEINRSFFEEQLQHLELSLSEAQINQFLMYYEILVEWNEFMNLTGITEFHEVVRKHFIDSLTIIKAVNMADINTVIDVGTGAGFPGIPLKIAFPHIKVVLLDSLNKRIKFLNHVIESLGLTDITCIHGRAEDFGKKNSQYRESFDLCVSRAVANMCSLLEYCMPFVAVGGSFVSYKSGKVTEELKEAKKALHLLNSKVKEQVSFTLADTDMERDLVVIEKIAPLSGKYPRKAGLPGKEPLK